MTPERLTLEEKYFVFICWIKLAEFNCKVALILMEYDKPRTPAVGTMATPPGRAGGPWPRLIGWGRGRHRDETEPLTCGDFAFHN